MSSAPANGFLERKYRLLLVGVLLLGAAVRVGVHLDLASADPAFDHPYLDSRNFLDWAGRIAEGDLLGEDRPFFLNPLYPYLLAPILRLAGDHALLVVRLLQMALGVLTILLVAGSARRLVDPAVALLAALLAAVYPVLLFYEQQVMIVTLAVFLNALALRALAAFAPSPTAGRTLLVGLTLGLAMLARPNIALFALLLPVWFALLAPRGAVLRFTLTRTAILMAGLLLPVLPVTARNAIVGGDLVLTTTSAGVNLYQANNPAAWRTGVMLSSEIRAHPTWMEVDLEVLAERDTGREMKPSEVSGYWVGKALAAMAESPGPALGHLGRKVLLFARAYEVPSSYHYEEIRRESGLLPAIPLSFGLLAPFALLGAAATLLRYRTALPFALMLAAYLAANTIFHPLSHHRSPVLAAAVPLAALGLIDLIRSVSERGWLRLAIGLIALHFLLLLGLSGPGEETVAEDRMVFLTNRGIALLGAGRPGLAETSLRNARDAKPSAVKPYLGLARLAREQGEPGREAMFLEECLKQRPGHPIAMADLGKNRYDRGRRKEGLELARRALAGDPPESPLYVSLARLYLRSGRFEDALGTYARARGKGLDDPGLAAEESTCLRLLGRLDDARRKVEAGLARAPGFGPLRFEMAHLLIATRPDDRDAIRRELEAARAAGWEIPGDLADWR